MTTPIATDTELSAVNSILGSIGQSPITTLNFQNPEISFIHNILTEVTKDLLNEGWHFNTEEHVKISPDANGNITIPKDYLRYDINEGQVDRHMDVVKRNGKLYDKVNHTDVFDHDMELDVVYLYNFEDVPSVFQRYIIARSSTRAATQLVTNPNLVKLLQQQEALARASLMEYETQQGDHSFLGWPKNSVYRSYQPYKSLIR
jgi:hypothetical protein|tara:strand:- start:9531 stop:10139 length:609 start_codon:yes stop_codon:yes gene_type:complete